MTSELAELKTFLTGTPFFGGLDEEMLERVVTMLAPRTMKKGEVVFREGELGRSMYVVESGELLACQSGGSGRAVKLMRFHQGDFFGETTLIEMQPRPFSVTVEADARLFELTNSNLYELYRTDVKAYVLVLQNINRELCRRLRAASNRVTAFADEAADDVTQIGMKVLPRG